MTEKIRLKYLCSKITDGSHFSPEVHDEGKHYITVSDVYDDQIHYENAKCISEQDFNVLVKNGCQPNIGDILLAKDGTVGRTAIVSDNDCVILSSLGILRPSDKISSKMLKYILDSDETQQIMKQKMAGSAIKRITISKIQEFKVTVPPLSEQQQIVEYLDSKTASIDSAIQAQRDIVEKLKEYKQAVITKAVTKGLNRDAEMKDSCIEWIGEIPNHWRVGRIKNLYNVTLGKMISPRQTASNQTYENYLCAANIKFSGVDTSMSKKMWFDQREKKQYLLQDGDVLFMEGGAAGTACMYKGEFAPCYIQNSVHKVVSKGQASNKYLYYMMNAAFNSGYISDICNKATIMHYTKEKVERTPILFPPVAEQQQIVEYLDSKTATIDKAIEQKNAIIEKLEEYKKSIIYNAVTGKIDCRKDVIPE